MKIIKNNVKNNASQVLVAGFEGFEGFGECIEAELLTAQFYVQTVNRPYFGT